MEQGWFGVNSTHSSSYSKPFEDYTRIDWHKKQTHVCACGTPLRPTNNVCHTAIDTPALRCPKCNTTLRYSSMAYFIRRNGSQLRQAPGDATYYEDVVREVLKEECVQ